MRPLVFVCLLSRETPVCLAAGLSAAKGNSPPVSTSVATREKSRARDQPRVSMTRKQQLKTTRGTRNPVAITGKSVDGRPSNVPFAFRSPKQE